MPLIRCRSSAPRPSTANAYMASTVWLIETKNATGGSSDDGGERPTNIASVDDSPTSGKTVGAWPDGSRVTALEFEEPIPDGRGDKLHILDLFNKLQSMPNLQDLTIRMEPGQLVLPPSSADLAAVPFRLRRLVLGEAFPGWIHLLRNSRNTLERLRLGCRPSKGPEYYASDGSCNPRLRYAETCEGVSLSEFKKLRALYMEGTPEPRLLSSCGRLTALTVTRALDLSIVQLCLRSGGLTRLTINHYYFPDYEALRIARALVDFAVFRTLRSLVVEVCHPLDDLKVTGHPGRMVLADACRARRIALTFVRLHWHSYREWEAL